MLRRTTAAWLPVVTIAALAAAGSWALARIPHAITERSGVGPPTRSIAAHPTGELELANENPIPDGVTIRWLIAGGGSSPEYAQVQLEQDIEQALEVFEDTGPGIVLFAGGLGSHAVQVLGEERHDESLRGRLGDLFDPRLGRDSAYRATTLRPNGAATAVGFLSALEEALRSEAEDAITVYLAGHGAGGAIPSDSHFLTWGPGDVWVEDIAGVLDDAPEHRTARFVVTACYAGGFAEIAFREGDAERGIAESDRCGFFATTWDRTAAGCDSNPDRGAQQGYGIHFLAALRGFGRDGEPLDPRYDIDGDERISLLEAHTVARIESGSLDVPVTTSERILRQIASSDETEGDETQEWTDPELREEELVIAQLAERLQIESDASAAERIDAIQEQLEPLANRLDVVGDDIERTDGALRAALLHRWPVLDDPWHPDFDAQLEQHGEAVAAYLDASGFAAHSRELRASRNEIGDRYDALLVESAPLARYERAVETRRLAGRLRAAGGESWASYRRVLTCERGGL